MVSLDVYIKNLLTNKQPHGLSLGLFESIDDNLEYKLERWFDRNESEQKLFIDIVKDVKDKNLDPTEIIDRLDKIGFNTEKFVNFVIDNKTATTKGINYPEIINIIIRSIINTAESNFR